MGTESPQDSGNASTSLPPITIVLSCDASVLTWDDENPIQKSVSSILSQNYTTFHLVALIKEATHHDVIIDIGINADTAKDSRLTILSWNHTDDPESLVSRDWSDIFARRQYALSKYEFSKSPPNSAGGESNDAFLLFLDECDSLEGSRAFQFLMSAWDATSSLSSTPVQTPPEKTSYGLPTHFLFTDMKFITYTKLDASGEPDDLSMSFVGNGVDYNVYDIAFGGMVASTDDLPGYITTLQQERLLPKRYSRSDTYRPYGFSPLTTSMFIPEKYWRRGYDAQQGTGVYERLSRFEDDLVSMARRWGAELKSTQSNDDEKEQTIESGDQDFEPCNPVEKFWVRMALKGFRGTHMPLHFLVGPPNFKPFPPYNYDNLHHNPARSLLCSIDIYKAAQLKDGTLINDLAAFKRLWRPAITVIVPFYNVPSDVWFRETMESLRAQTFSDFEVVIVDDGTDVSKDYKGWKELIKLKRTLLKGRIWCGFSSSGGTSSSCDGDTFARTCDGSDTTSTHTWLPIRIIHHTKNYGLAEGRNTGVRHALSPYIIFLDPDDKLEPTALEKLVLFSLPTVGNPVPRRGGTAYYGFAYPGTVHFGAKNDIVFAEYSESRLAKENFMTATTLILRSAFIEAGGMCPRTIVRYFEDYDFWLRMATYGYRGVLLREPLFWYRRHALGQSTNIIRDAATERRKKKVVGGATEEYLEEARKNNPVPFGDLPRNEMIRMLKYRFAEDMGLTYDYVDRGLANEAPPQWESGRASIPCYRCMDPFDLVKYPHIAFFERLKWQEYGYDELPSPDVETGFLPMVSNLMNFVANTLGLLPDEMDGNYRRSPHRPIDVPRRLFPSSPPRIFPFNPAHYPRSPKNGAASAFSNNAYISETLPHSSSSSKSADRISVMYIMPWMVLGGADLYDLTVLESLFNSPSSSPTNTQGSSSTPLCSRFHITIVLERAIPDQTWAHLFQQVSHEIFNLQLMSNDSSIQDSFLDYLVVSRNVRLVINTRTVVGYRAFERWGKWARGEEGTGIMKFDEGAGSLSGDSDPALPGRLRCKWWDCGATSRTNITMRTNDGSQETKTKKPQEHGYWGRMMNPSTHGIKTPAIAEHQKSFFSRIRLIDILHLYHLGDRTNWEWRAGRVGWTMHRRVVVSRDLRDYMVERVGCGDRELGKEPQGETNRTKATETSQATVPDRSLPPQEREKLTVIYPPVDLSSWGKTQSTRQSTQSKAGSHLWYRFGSSTPSVSDSRTDLSRCENTILPEDVSNIATDRPTIFFLGRFDEQKNPELWLETALQVYNLITTSLAHSNNPNTSTPPTSTSTLFSQTKPRIPRFILIGSGPLHHAVDKALRSPKYRPLLQTTELVGSLPHDEAIDLLARPTQAVLLMTSRFEGVPISAMEAVALGVPVVSIDCGGWREVVEDPEVWGSADAKDQSEGTENGKDSVLGSTIQQATADFLTSDVDEENTAKVLHHGKKSYLVSRSPQASTVLHRCEGPLKKSSRDAAKTANRKNEQKLDVGRSNHTTWVSRALASEIIKIFQKMATAEQREYVSSQTLSTAAATADEKQEEMINRACAAIKVRHKRFEQSHRFREKYGARNFQQQWRELVQKTLGELV
ncbi:hypothetical protein HK102_004798 [Quaeritorhiza haematococci]|nr:hypothetical protein HK102_004798 [Quaeritorhiza haematococci]